MAGRKGLAQDLEPGGGPHGTCCSGPCGKQSCSYVTTEGPFPGSAASTPGGDRPLPCASHMTDMHAQPVGYRDNGGGLATWDPELSAGTARVLTVNIHSQDSHLSGLGRVLHNSWPPSLNTGRLCLTAPEVCGCAAVIVRQTLLLKQGGSSVRERQLDPLSNPRIA